MNTARWHRAYADDFDGRAPRRHIVEDGRPTSSGPGPRHCGLGMDRREVRLCSIIELMSVQISAAKSKAPQVRKPRYVIRRLDRHRLLSHECHLQLVTVQPELLT